VRVLVLSDIHANWEALEAALNSAAGRYDRIVCCGDLIGYGPDPNRVVDWVRRNVATVIRGNHDKVTLGAEILEWFNPVAKAAAIWTLNELAPENLAYVRQLSKGPVVVDGYQIVHGSPLDEDEYLFGADEVEQAFAYLDRDLTFFGHTHVQGGFMMTRRRVRMIAGARRSEQAAALDLSSDETYLINPGAIGQPRDGDPRAAYLIYDPDDRSVIYCRERYDIGAVQTKIRSAGLPDVLADRLILGQ